MHISDSLLSLETGGVYLVLSGAALIYSAGKADRDSRNLPMAAVMAAFVFAAQMINFTIPGTGSSGHLGGGMLLTYLLGPPAALLAISSVLVIQALVFADGGLLALGTNIFNMGIIPAFIVFPLFRKYFQSRESKGRFPGPGLFTASMTAVFLGAVSVVLQLYLSGMLDLSLVHFTLLMLPIHLAIGVGEGLITVAVVRFVNSHSLISGGIDRKTHAGSSLIISLFSVTLLIAAVLSWYASSHPDGLEWSLEHGGIEIPGDETGGLRSETLQTQLSLLPDYGFPGAEGSLAEKAGTTFSGIAGSVLVLGIFSLLILVSRFMRRNSGGHGPN